MIQGHRWGQGRTGGLETNHHRRFRERVEAWSIYMTDERPIPVERDRLTVHLELDDDALDRKMAALYAMQSQVAPVLDLMSPTDFRTLYRQESFVTADVGSTVRSTGAAARRSGDRPGGG